MLPATCWLLPGCWPAGCLLAACWLLAGLPASGWQAAAGRWQLVAGWLLAIAPKKASQKHFHMCHFAVASCSSCSCFCCCGCCCCCGCAGGGYCFCFEGQANGFMRGPGPCKRKIRTPAPGLLIYNRHTQKEN